MLVAEVFTLLRCCFFSISEPAVATEVIPLSAFLDVFDHTYLNHVWGTVIRQRDTAASAYFRFFFPVLTLHIMRLPISSVRRKTPLHIRTRASSC